MASWAMAHRAPLALHRTSMAGRLCYEQRRRGFTLVELAIVIAILRTIAVVVLLDVHDNRFTSAMTGLRGWDGCDPVQRHERDRKPLSAAARWPYCIAARSPYSGARIRVIPKETLTDG